ncbi:MAG: 3'-5' exonuclease [Gammaproteobacteria bacterium]
MKSCARKNADTVVVLDFETTGLSPDQGDRAIEIGAVRIENGKITGHFQQLMNPQRRVSSFIESYTGITNAMLRDAPPCDAVMAEFSEFIGDFDMVAHNASFDRRFLDAELQRIRCGYTGEFACSMLVSRRIYPDAPNHKLGTLVEYKGLPTSGTFHRALADAEMTAHLWLRMLDDISERHCLAQIPLSLLQELSRLPKAATAGYLQRRENRGS